MSAAAAKEMVGKSVVVTGASSGIGAAAAVELARRGARVTAVGRDEERLAKVAHAIGEASGEEAPAPLRADFASLEEVRGLAADIAAGHERIDVLVNNAGLVTPAGREQTANGYERTFQVNHLAPFLLTRLLLDRLRESAPARVVTTSSGAHYSGHINFDDLQGARDWSSWQAYCDSKLANVAFTHELARRVEGSEITANCLHPGMINTRLFRGSRGAMSVGLRVAKPFFGSAKRGAATIVYLATSPEGGEVSGSYFDDCKRKRPRPEGTDDVTTERLWKVSEELVGLR